MAEDDEAEGPEGKAGMKSRKRDKAARGAGVDRPDPVLFSAMKMEVENQCEFALMAFEDLQANLAAGSPKRIWYSVQGLLIAAGNLSKLLYATGGRKRRCEELRKILGLAPTSPIAPRNFRNHFEHFDERLESWARSSKRKNIVDRCITRPGAIPWIDPDDYLRNLDRTTLTVTFRGDRFPLVPVVEEVRRIQSAVSAAERAAWIRRQMARHGGARPTTRPPQGGQKGD